MVMAIGTTILDNMAFKKYKRVGSALTQTFDTEYLASVALRWVFRKRS